ncbi:D-tyrosyl-tRNA(Tyr) deacylase [Candidatus Nomurabacteria bacterium]|nr:D-tyrosyl-tRNA(Tyr) deacylase [Candidatus Nomurabacteria bacterium]
MRIVLQKVKRSFVEVDTNIVGEIADGYLLLLAVHRDDSQADADKLIEKVLKLRLFSDPGSESFMEKSIMDVEGGILVVSQFTLYGDCKKGTRPSFSDSARPQEAKELYEYFAHKLRADSGLRVETGEFGAYMEVQITNDGPITLILDS